MGAPPASAAPAAHQSGSITYSTPKPLTERQVDTIVDETTAQMARDFAGNWEADTPYVDPALRAVWDAKSKKQAQPMIEKARRAGFPAHIAILPPLELPAGVNTFEVRKRVYNELFTGFADTHPGKNALLVVIEVDGQLKATGAVLRGGALIDDAVPLSPDVANEAAGPVLHYAVRSALGAAKNEPVTGAADSESDAWLPLGEPTSFGAGGSGGINLVVAGSIVAAAVLCCILYLIGWGIVRTMRRRREESARGRYAAAERINALGKQAALARRQLSKLRPGNDDGRAPRLKQAAACLPAPGDTDDPVVLAAWIRLAGFGTRRGDFDVCFFDPTERATETRFSTEVGADVPVCAAAADAIDHDEQPHYLSHDGFNTGKPYWTVGTSPFARSGFGAFTELAGEIIDAADDGRWSAADHCRTSPAGARERTGGLPRIARSPWTTVAAFVVLPIIIGVPVGAALTTSMEADYERVRPSSPLHPDPATLTNAERVTEIASALKRSHVYVHSSMRPIVGTELEKTTNAKARGASNTVYVLAAPSVGGDDTAGDTRLLASRIASKVDTDALYIYVDSTGATRDFNFTHEPADYERADKLEKPLEDETDTKAALDGWIDYVDDVKWKSLGYEMDVEADSDRHRAVYPAYKSQAYRDQDHKSLVKGAIAGPAAEIVLVAAIVFILGREDRHGRKGGWNW